jgi:hypothetical protein
MPAALVAGAGVLHSDHVINAILGVRSHESGLGSGKMMRRVEVLSCYSKLWEEHHGAADSWYVSSIVQLCVKIQANQVKGAISFFTQIFPANFLTKHIHPVVGEPSRKSRVVLIANPTQLHQLVAIRETLLPFLGLPMMFQ